MNLVITAIYQHDNIALLELLKNQPRLACTELPNNKLGWQLIHLAASIGNHEAIKYLLSQGIVAEVTDNQGWQAIHIAGLFGHLEVIKTLLANGAQFQAQT